MNRHETSIARARGNKGRSIMHVKPWIGLLLLSIPTLASAQVQLPKGEEEVNRASALIVSGRYGEAEPLLRQAVVNVPGDPYAYFNLASVLRATGRNEEAIANYQRAQSLFAASGKSANGPGDIANCLYGVALAREAGNDPRAAAQAWNDYIGYAQRFAREQPAVAIAREHVDEDQRLARARGPALGPQQATRPRTIQ
jgi:tetratricopeptide (TPR) repeat protein